MSTICGDSDNISTISACYSMKAAAYDVNELSKTNERIVPTWMTSETESMDQLIDAYRAATERTKEAILELKSREDISGNYDQMKETAQRTEAMSKLWMTCIKQFKTQLCELTNKLNGCCDSKVLQKNAVEQMATTVGSEDDIALLDKLPPLEYMTRIICDQLVGRLKLNKDTNSSGGTWQHGNYVPPRTIIIEKLKNGFYKETRLWPGAKATALFRPDNIKRGNSQVELDRHYGRVVHEFEDQHGSHTITYAVNSDSDITVIIRSGTYGNQRSKYYSYTIDR